jgi:hypothetical protein
MRGARSFFEGRKVVIATQHKKEKVIAPWLKSELGLEAFVTNEYNTDALGTFSGEIPRVGDPVEVLRKKCIGAMDLLSAEIGIANEGSFGPHPAAYFAPADEEWVILIDRKNGWEIVERVVSLSTNFSGGSFDNWEDVQSFAHQVKFPSHALIAKKEKDQYYDCVKGISDWHHLEKLFRHFYKISGSIYLETDMRAMNNPTRMLVIEDATRKLIEKVNSLCRNCGSPGFGVSLVSKGLPCGLCGQPTSSALKHIFKCLYCENREEKNYPNGKQFENPMYCDFCNP